MSKELLANGFQSRLCCCWWVIGGVLDDARADDGAKVLLWRYYRLSQWVAMSSWPRGRPAASGGARPAGFGSQSWGQRAREGDRGGRRAGEVGLAARGR